MGTKCLKTNDYNITVTNIEQIAEITSIIYLCSIDAAELFIIDCSENIQTDLTQKFDELDEIFEVNEETLQIDVVSLNDTILISSTITDIDNEDQNDAEWLIIYPVFAAILFCVAAICVFMKYKVNHRTKKHRKQIPNKSDEDNAAHMNTINERTNIVDASEDDVEDDMSLLNDDSVITDNNVRASIDRNENIQ